MKALRALTGTRPFEASEIPHFVQDDRVDGSRRFKIRGELMRLGGNAPTYYIYILASRSDALYIGVTNDLTGRIAEHRAGSVLSFTERYRIVRLVYFEEFSDPASAIEREKVQKRWTRTRKLELIRTINPTMADLSVELA